MNHTLSAKRGFQLLVLLNLLSIQTFSQTDSTVTFGKVTAEDFNLPKIPIIDSSTNGVIISLKGSVNFVGTLGENTVSYVYKVSARMLILNKKAFDLGTVYLGLHQNGDRKDELLDLKAATYNLENGAVKKTELAKGDIYEERISPSRVDKRFTLPDLKEGSIIEYTYTIRSPRYWAVPPWSFQSDPYPVLYSRYKVTIPDLLRFVTVRYGIDSLASYTTKEGDTTLYFATVNVNTKTHTHEWVMKDIPGFKTEDFLVNPNNYLDHIEFELIQFFNGIDATEAANSWEKEGKQLVQSYKFGQRISVDGTANLNRTMKQNCSQDSSALYAARQLYYYVRDNFTREVNDDISIYRDLYDVDKLKKGSVAELNMLLIGLLRQRGLYADPVILATRSYGHISEKFPVDDECNYVICMLRINGDTLLLDASDPTMGFGKIPLQCFNGLAEIIDNHYTDPLYLDPSRISDPETTSVLLVNNSSGPGESGSLQHMAGYYESAALRELLATKEGRKNYLDFIKARFGPDDVISDFKIDSLRKVEYPLTVNYDLALGSGFSDDIIYFDPVLEPMYKENPFKAEVRRLPVEFSSPVNKSYDITMDIPNGYMVDELPKSLLVNFNGAEGRFLYQIMKDDYTVQLHMELKLNSAIFAPGDYQHLRDFFAMVIKKEGEQVVFKKK